MKLKFSKFTFLIILLFFSKNIYSLTNSEYLQVFNQTIDKIMLYQDYNYKVKGEKCLYLGKSEYIINELLDSDLKIESKNEKKLRKSIKKFLSRKSYFCNESNWHIWFNFINRIQNKKLFKNIKKLKMNVNTWAEKYTDQEWKQSNIVLDRKNESQIIVQELENISPQVQNTLFSTWKPRLCRITGVTLARQELLNIYFPPSLRHTFSFYELVKSMNSIENEVCLGIRMGAKFDREKSSWIDNLKWLGRRDSNPRPID